MKMKKVAIGPEILVAPERRYGQFFIAYFARMLCRQLYECAYPESRF